MPFETTPIWSQRLLRIAPAVFLGVALLLFAGVALRAVPSSASEAVVVPPPLVDEPAGAVKPEVAVLAGGCFWGVQGVFQHVAGVISATSGYTGGAKATADYETVSSGTTGHAESVRIIYDPTKISYGRLLQIYFSVAHDPTELNRQGPYSGTQYRSALFPTPSKPSLRRPTSLSLMPPTCSRHPSSPASSLAVFSIRPSSIIRTIRPCIPMLPIS